MSATLKLSRSFRWMSPTKFPIVLDAQEVGTIANHRTTELPIEPGTHTLQIVVSKRLTSPILTFVANDDETIAFACHARGPFFLAGPWAFVSLLINHSWWIVLKRSQPGTPAAHDHATPARSPVPTS
jgi:hypothetical protein